MENFDNNFLDEQFRARLENHASDVPPQLFDRIMRERERARPVAWWRWTFLGISLLTFAGAAMWYFATPKTVETASNVRHENDVENIGKNLNPASNEVIKTTETNDQNISQKPNFYSQTEQNVEKKMEKNGEKIIVKNDFKNITPKNISKNSIPKSGTENLNQQIEKNIEKNIENPNLLTKNAPPPVSDAIRTTENGISSISVAQSATKQPQTTPSTQGIGFSPMTLSPLPLIAKSLLSTSAPTKTPILKLLDEGCSSFGKKRNGRMTYPQNSFLIDIYASPDVAMRRFSDRTNEGNAYLNTRKLSEKQWYAFSAGARLSYIFSNGFAVRAGAHYGQVNEIFNFQASDSSSRETLTKIEIRNSSGQVIRIDSFITVEYGYRRIVTHNRYRSFDIPVQIGYEFHLSRTWNMGINTGVNFNISSWNKAQILDANGQPAFVS
ncbi:MAG: hypothetical protein RL757_1290, partial [Bacteroidota bacterium]